MHPIVGIKVHKPKEIWNCDYSHESTFRILYFRYLYTYLCTYAFTSMKKIKSIVTRTALADYAHIWLCTMLIFNIILALMCYQFGKLLLITYIYICMRCTYVYSWDGNLLHFP